MEKIWFIIINGKKEGPYSVSDLKKDKRISPVTLVWRAGFENWVPIGEVEELKSVFKDQSAETEEEPEEKELPPDEEVALQLKVDPPSFLYLIILLVIVLLIYLLLL